jgi:hypothetical protein
VTVDDQPQADPHLTRLLDDALGPYGFTAVAPRHALSRHEAAVAHHGHGVTVHIDADCARIILAARDPLPLYRLLLPRHTGLTPAQTVAVAAYHVQLLLADRER